MVWKISHTNSIWISFFDKVCNTVLVKQINTFLSVTDVTKPELYRSFPVDSNLFSYKIAFVGVYQRKIPNASAGAFCVEISSALILISN